MSVSAINPAYLPSSSSSALSPALKAFGEACAGGCACGGCQTTAGSGASSTGLSGLRAAVAPTFSGTPTARAAFNTPSGPKFGGFNPFGWVGHWFKNFMHNQYYTLAGHVDNGVKSWVRGVPFLGNTLANGMPHAATYLTWLPFAPK